MARTADPIAAARLEVAGLKDQLDGLYTDYQSAVSEVQINFQGELHKYMCIRLAGYLEQLFFVAIGAYVKASANQQVSSFVLEQWRSAPNLTPEALDRLVNRFGYLEWSDSLKAVLEATGGRGDLGTLMKIRNLSAHGSTYRGSLRSIGSYKALIDDLHRWVHRTILQ